MPAHRIDARTRSGDAPNICIVKGALFQNSLRDLTRLRKPAMMIMGGPLPFVCLTQQLARPGQPPTWCRLQPQRLAYLERSASVHAAVCRWHGLKRDLNITEVP
jgi:hypothetical protein